MIAPLGGTEYGATAGPICAKDPFPAPLVVRTVFSSDSNTAPATRRDSRTLHEAQHHCRARTPYAPTSVAVIVQSGRSLSP